MADASIDNVEIGGVAFTIIDNVATMTTTEALASAGFALVDVDLTES